MADGGWPEAKAKGSTLGSTVSLCHRGSKKKSMADGRRASQRKGSTLCSTVSLCHRGSKKEIDGRWPTADGRRASQCKGHHCVPLCHCAAVVQKTESMA